MFVDLVDNTTCSQKAARVAELAGHINPYASKDCGLASAVVFGNTFDNLAIAAMLVSAIGKFAF